MQVKVRKRRKIPPIHVVISAVAIVIAISVIVFNVWSLPDGTGKMTQDTATEQTTASEPVAIEPLPTAEPDMSVQRALDEYAASSSGTYMIAMREIGGKGRTATVQPDRLTVAASTYKLFVAYGALYLSEKSELDMTTVVHQGKTIAQCIDIAILESENECIKAVGFFIGWQRITDITHAAGYKSVFLDNFNADRSFNGNKFVNAGDEAQFLYNLQAGKLLDEKNTDYLLGLMKRQIHRSGIPAGASGSVVANKPGWLDGSYYHDAGIVYTDVGDYVLVVMTEGIGNWTGVKAVSELVYDAMSK